jgi:ribose-phosphate pyrophosphokinase
MKKIHMIIACSNGESIAKRLAKRLKQPYSRLFVEKFPDNETHLRFLKDVKNKNLIFVQSFYGNINDQLIEVWFAARTAKELGAKKLTLVAPYFPYLRQDKRFKPGDCRSVHVVAEFVDKLFDRILICDPHLHREKQLSHIFTIHTTKITANPLLADYIKKHIKDALIVGPDWESYKWAEKTADMIGCGSAIMEKERYSGRKVEVKLKSKDKGIDVKAKNIVLAADTISTGHTIMEAIKLLKKIGAKKFTVLAVHGIFVEKALEKIQKLGAKVITTNTIPNKVAKIDVSKLIAVGLRKI